MFVLYIFCVEKKETMKKKKLKMPKKNNFASKMQKKDFISFLHELTCHRESPCCAS